MEIIKVDGKEYSRIRQVHRGKFTCDGCCFNKRFGCAKPEADCLSNGDGVVDTYIFKEIPNG